MNLFRDSRLLVGFETSDDAGVFKIDEQRSLVQTVDFITPVVDDPYTFGQIAALNSLSDVYAMGGVPLTAMSVLMYNCDIDEQIIQKMMQGACDELAKVGCTLLGGHTVDDAEVKLGFAVTGMVDGDTFYRNSTLRTDDVLIYTQSLGIGIASTALKGEMATEDEILAVQQQMLLSNFEASKAMKQFDVSACTDVTGFGLGGHGYEMAVGSGKTVTFFVDDIHILPAAIKYAEMGIIPQGAYYNKQFMVDHYQYTHSDRSKEIICFDPQTSGGLLIGVSKNDAEALLATLAGSGYSEATIVGVVSDLSDNHIFFQ